MTKKYNDRNGFRAILIGRIAGEDFLWKHKMPVTPLLPLIREPSDETREKVIESVRYSLESQKHPLTGVFVNYPLR